jgi:hypothetical protein
MRWGQFGFAWPADDQQLAVFSYHSARTLNEVAIDTIKERGKNKTHPGFVKILDFFWSTLARSDNTDVDNVETQSAGSHPVHQGVDTMRLLVSVEVMLILRHFCSDFVDRILKK